MSRRTVLENLRNLPHAPGAQMQNVPSRRLGKELGMKDGDLSDPEDEVEARIKSELSPLFALPRADPGRTHETPRHERVILFRRR